MIEIYKGIPAWMKVLREIYLHKEETITQIKLYNILREQEKILTYSFIVKITNGLKEHGFLTRTKKGRTIIMTLTNKGLKTSESINGVCKYAEIK